MSSNNRGKVDEITKICKEGGGGWHSFKKLEFEWRFVHCAQVGQNQLQSTYIYRVQSSVWHLLNYWPPTPLHPASVSSPRTKGGGVQTRRAVRGWGVNISEDARHWIGLLQYNPTTEPTLLQPS